MPFSPTALLSKSPTASAWPSRFIYCSVTTASEDGEAAHIRNWIVRRGTNAQGTIIESHLSLGQAATVTNVVTESQHRRRRKH